MLQRLVRTAAAQAAARERRIPFEQVEKYASEAPAPKGFATSLSAAVEIGLIAELKRASPSAGRIRDTFEVPELAAELTRAGADCLSVLTEPVHFQGALQNLGLAAVADTPRLQKDFILSEYQVWEGRASGADAVLLIAEALAAARVRTLSDLALSLGMDVLIEAHSSERVRDVERLAARAPDRILVGINNRDLDSFRVDLQTTLDIIPQVSKELHVVGESGIRTPEDVGRLRDAGVGSILVGESIMRQADVGLAVRHLLSAVRSF
jgi:indole-3-glycerol phosphate synthase